MITVDGRDPANGGAGMNWIRKKWLRSSFASQIIFLFIVLWFLPTCIMFTIVYGSFQQGMN